VYDSDTYEFVVFNAGKQIDLVMPDPEQYSGPLRVLSGANRAKQWGKAFGTPVTAAQITQAATKDSVFADDALAELSRLVGLTGGQSQLHYRDVVDNESGVQHLHFRKSASARPAPEGHVVLRDYFDPDNSRMLLVVPASWPVPLSEEVRVTWLMLSEGAGFSEGTLAIRVTGPEGIEVVGGHMEGAKFHNGQIVGPLETAPRESTDLSPEDVLEATQFEVRPDSSESGSQTFTARFPRLDIPTKAPNRPTQILIILQVALLASREGEWDIDVSVRPAASPDYQHDLPRSRIAGVERKWVPVVSGLNSKARYDTADLATTPPRGPLMLRELQHKQASIRHDRSLDHFAIASNAAILPDDCQASLDACRAYLEAWLQPLAERSGEIRIHAEKRMTERAYVGKTRKTLPTSSFLRDKAWQKLFDAASNYQSVLISILREDGAYPIAGVGMQVGMEQYPEQWREHQEQQVADSLSTMRGRRFERAPIVNTAHVFNWVLNHDDCYRYLGTSIDEMRQQLDSFAARHAVLQAWHSQSTWRPLFDHADDYERTAYEEHSVLNWFRGILQTDGGLNAQKMSLEWCRNVVRMVTPHMWMCRALLEQVDREQLEAVADLTESSGAFKIALRSGRGLDDLELALLPVLPVESARLKKS
jgi:hypothetical protein